MSEYDNTNRGVIFQPHQDQRLSGQGNINVDGAEHRVVVIYEPIKRDGERRLVVYQKIGVLFPNDSENENAPNFSGPLDPWPTKRVAAWSNEKDGRKYMSLAISERQRDASGDQNQSQDDVWSAPPPPDDEIPF